MLSFRTTPLFSYTTTIDNYIWFLTPEAYFLQEETPTGTMMFLGYDADGENEVWTPDVDIDQKFPVTPETLLMKLMKDFNEAEQVEIPREFLYLSSGCFDNYRTGILINGQPLYITQDRRDSKCKVLLGVQFVQHLQDKSSWDYSEEPPF